MPWVRFSRRFAWRPSPQSLVHYSAGDLKLVTHACAEAAIAAGAGVEEASPMAGKPAGAPKKRKPLTHG